jgi:hypothetical protein
MLWKSGIAFNLCVERRLFCLKILEVLEFGAEGRLERSL